MSGIRVSQIIDDLNKKKFGKRFFLFVMGMLFAAMSFNLFFKPYNIIPSGSSGLAFLISYISTLDVALVSLCINIVLLLIGLIFFGKDYAIKMVAVTVLYPVF